MNYLINTVCSDGTVFTDTVKEISAIRSVLDIGDEEPIEFERGVCTYFDRYTGSVSTIAQIN